MFCKFKFISFISFVGSHNRVTFQVSSIGLDYESNKLAPVLMFALNTHRANTDGGLGKAFRQSNAAPFTWRQCERQIGRLYYPGIGKEELSGTIFPFPCAIFDGHAIKISI